MALATPFLIAASATAAGPLQLWVSVNGDDTSTCSQVEPCATVQRAVDVAGTGPAVIEYSGEQGLGNAIAIGSAQHITIAGHPVGDDHQLPVLEYWPSGGRTTPMITNEGDLTIDGVELEGISAVEIDQLGGSLEVTGSQFAGDYLALRMSGGSARLDRSAVTFQDTVSTAVELSGGSLALADTTVSAPIVQTGGDLRTTHLASGDVPHTLQLSGGSAEIDSSGFFEDAWPVSVGGTATVTLDHDSFAGSDGVTVDGAAASATVVASSFSGSDDPLAATNGGTLRLAATAVDGGGPAACSGQIVDGGYNSAWDESCHFTAPGSVNSAPAVQMHPASIDGPYDMIDLVPLAGPSFQGEASTLVDKIPDDATATFDPNIDLCTPGSLDQRGQTRPVVGRCDIGAVELGPSAITLTASARSLVYGQPLTLSAKVSQPSGVPLRLLGHVMFGGSQTPLGSRCYDSPLRADATARCTWRPYGLRSTFTATYIPTDALHASTASIPVDIARESATITASGPRAITVGHHATLSARWRTDHTRTTSSPYVGLRLQARDSATAQWHWVTKWLPTSTSGPVRTTVAPARTTQYRWVTPGDVYSYRAASSAVLTLQVDQQLSAARLTHKRVRAGHEDVVYGSLRPAVTGQRVELQALHNGHWVRTPYSAHVAMQQLPDGRTVSGYVIAFRFARAGRHVLRVTVPATARFGAVHTPAVRMTTT